MSFQLKITTLVAATVSIGSPNTQTRTKLPSMLVGFRLPANKLNVLHATFIVPTDNNLQNKY